MEYYYSKHFLQRMQERKITFAEVQTILAGIVDTLEVPSKIDQNVKLIFGYVNLKGIAIIINKNTHVLITIRRMRKNEENLFGGAR